MNRVFSVNDPANDNTAPARPQPILAQVARRAIDQIALMAWLLNRRQP